MLRIALPAYVYDLTGSTLATGLMFMVSTLPSIVLGSVAGVFVDRWDRQRTMVIINLILAAALLPLRWVRSTETPKRTGRGRGSPTRCHHFLHQSVGRMVSRATRGSPL